MTSRAIIVRPSVSARDAALSLVASSMPQGKTVVSLTRSPTGTGSDEDEVELCVLNFPFQDHGVGGVVWHAAIVMSHHIAQREGGALFCGGDGGLTTQARVLELGAGSAALGGLACAACHGANAVVTDLPELMKLTRQTLKENRVAVEKSNGCIKSYPLAWGEAIPARLSGCCFDLIIGADIIYRNELHGALLQTLVDLCDPSKRRAGSRGVKARATASTGPAPHEHCDQSAAESSTEPKSGTSAFLKPLQQKPPSAAAAAAAAATLQESPSTITLEQKPLSSLPEDCVEPGFVQTRVLLSFQVRHPEEEASFFARAAALGFSVTELGLAELSMLSEWQRTHERLMELKWRRP